MASALEESAQAVEVSEVKAAFPGRCRVVTDVGLFRHVVTLQPQDMDVTLKFQLADSYPSTIPDISVRSDSLTCQNIQEMQEVLTSQARALVGGPMLTALVQQGEQWLHSHGVRPGKTVNAKADVLLTGAKKKVRKQKHKKRCEELEEGEAKKPSMKTADDVIKRILWDDKLDRDDFLVGYLDRFKGIMEKYFSAFSWEDIASVDYDVLAVPKHRIQYFKYRSQKIWDKPSRTDNVFGSTGSGITVYDVINNYQEPPEDSGSAQNSANTAATPDDDSFSDSDDSDDGINVVINNSVNTPMGEEELEEEVDVGGAYNPYWQDKMRPNYFLALRITDPEVVQGVQQVQDYLLDNEPLYGPCCIPPCSLHITLCTLGLDSPEQIAHAAQVLQRIKPELASNVPVEPLRVEGVSNFFNRVVYAQVKPHPAFLEFVNYLKLLIREAGVEIRDNHDFVAHMTIMKVTRPVARQKGSKFVDHWLYSNFTDMDFGLQAVDNVYLCSMGDDRREDGFYVCPAEIHFP